MSKNKTYDDVYQLDMDSLIGKTVEIVYLKDESIPVLKRYLGKRGVVQYVDRDFNNEPRIHGTWGGIALYRGEFKEVK